MNVNDLQKRIQRLDDLSRGFGKETVAIFEENNPLSFVERREYSNAIHEIMGGLQNARIALLKAVERLTHSDPVIPLPNGPDSNAQKA